MKEIFIASDNLITSLGFSTGENLERMLGGETGILPWDDRSLSPAPFWASRVADDRLRQLLSSFASPEAFTRFEQMVICSIKSALDEASIKPGDEKTLLILSTTKGNIDLLSGKKENGSIYLWETARKIQSFFKLANEPLVVSNACVSGVLALITAARLIREGKYNRVIVAGADVVSEFVLSGFNSFLSLSNGPCKPFDKNRQGLSLGEAAGTIILTNDESDIPGPVKMKIGYGFSANDANHISGPSRTGEGLYRAISRTLEKNGIKVDYISAHGTATPYNDDMESIAINRAGLQDIPVNSFKGFWGHTLGAAGVIESIATSWCIANNRLIRTLGLEEPGVAEPVSVILENREAYLHTGLKIASGFGGSNAALIIYK
jgi:3-oxoacyl-[acyl-carrier-protein] synthase I